jgi:hypothetical protein
MLVVPSSSTGTWGFPGVLEHSREVQVMKLCSLQLCTLIVT